MDKKTQDNHWLQPLQSNRDQQDHVIHTRVVGVTYDNRQAVVAMLRVGEKVRLKREPTNAYDSNAIRVERCDGAQIGYINRYMASNLAPTFDSHGGPVKGTVSQLLGNPFAGYNLGVEIRFMIPV